MWSLRTDYEADSARLAEATAAARGLAAGAAELDAMRAAQRATAERIALLQGLLQARRPRLPGGTAHGVLWWTQDA